MGSNPTLSAKNMENNNLPETITWNAPSHTRTSRSPAWYIVFGIISVALIFFGVYNHSILMIVTFSVVILSVMLLSAQEPKNVVFKATKSGIVSGSIVYPYKTIKTFWIIYNPPVVKTLNFETSAYLNNHISMELGQQDPTELKLYLSQYIPEDLDREESLTDTLARNLKI